MQGQSFLSAKVPWDYTDCYALAWPAAFISSTCTEVVEYSDYRCPELAPAYMSFVLSVAGMEASEFTAAITAALVSVIAIASQLVAAADVIVVAVHDSSRRTSSRRTASRRPQLLHLIPSLIDDEEFSNSPQQPKATQLSQVGNLEAVGGGRGSQPRDHLMQARRGSPPVVELWIQMQIVDQADASLAKQNIGVQVANSSLLASFIDAAKPEVIAPSDISESDYTYFNGAEQTRLTSAPTTGPPTNVGGARDGADPINMDDVWLSPTEVVLATSSLMILSLVMMGLFAYMQRSRQEIREFRRALQHQPDNPESQLQAPPNHAEWLRQQTNIQIPVPVSVVGIPVPPPTRAVSS